MASKVDHPGRGKAPEFEFLSALDEGISTTFLNAGDRVVDDGWTVSFYRPGLFARAAPCALLAASVATASCRACRAIALRSAAW